MHSSNNPHQRDIETYGLDKIENFDCVGVGLLATVVGVKIAQTSQE
jgi:hypothetical protein